MNAHIDENTKATGIGVVQGATDILVPLRIDDATKEVLIEIIPVGDPLSALVASRIHIDENTHQIAAAVTNDSNETITPLTVDMILDLPCLRVEIL